MVVRIGRFYGATAAAASVLFAFEPSIVTNAFVCNQNGRNMQLCINRQEDRPTSLTSLRLFGVTSGAGKIPKSPADR